MIRYVLLLQHPSDLEEVTSRENANLLTIKTQYSPARSSARTLAMNSMKPMLCNNKQTNKQNSQFYELPLSRTYCHFDRRVVTPLSLRPVTLLLLVSGRGNQRERESWFGLAVRRSRTAAARFRFGSPFSSKRLWFVDTVLSSQLIKH